MSYAEFLASKRMAADIAGFEAMPEDVHSMLFGFQRDITTWACRKGRAAVLLDAGLGKTFVQLEWARLSGERALLLAPLSVARQTVREGKKIGLDVHYVRNQAQVTGDDRLWITNYEMLDQFDPSAFGAVVLDESSILKSMDGKTRARLIDVFRDTPYRLCCTATPAPNDYTELGNHAEFLGICSTQEMLATYFINANRQQTVQTVDGRVIEKKGRNDGGTEWRLKHHAEEAFFKWLASWAVTMAKPSDLGYEDNGFVLPPLTINPIFVESGYQPDDRLFFMGLKGIADRMRVRRGLLDLRLDALRGLVENSTGQWIVWVGLNDEGTAVAAALPGSIEVRGSETPECKARAFEEFQDGLHRVLVTKSRIGGMGMNFQNAHHMAFFGLNDSWEQFYQAVRREWRYNQHSPVDVHLILADVEEEIYRNVMRKDALATRLRQKLIAAARDYEREELGMASAPLVQAYETREWSGNGWRLLLGDSCERLAEIESESVDLSVYSPPFADLFTYSASDRDLGNCKGWDEFFVHYAFIIREVLRVTKPGRLTCVHTSDIPAMQARDGWIGLRDFPGEVIRAYEREGWEFVGRAFVQKNPQAQAIRVKSKALLFVQLRKDSADSRPALVDQVLLFKRPGENRVPVRPVDNGELDNEAWIEWANGIWLGINESDTLQYHEARDKDDEKHICPLQLGTIERCVKLYSNPGELVLSPFTGIGSEGYTAVRFGRRFVGIELKPSYAEVAARNLADAESRAHAPTLFDALEAEQDALNGAAVAAASEEASEALGQGSLW